MDAEYRYDGQGNRVQKILDPFAADPDDTTTITYVYDAFGKLAAEYSSKAPTGAGGRFFRTTDHLGSTRLVTDAQGLCRTWQDFYPFGERILKNASTGRDGWSCYGGAGTDPFEQEFTAKERDEESDLDYFGARYYGSSLGRFTSVDPNNAGVRLGNPQSWNGYGYSINNPLRYVDPDGRDFLDAVEGFANAFGSNAVGGIGRVSVGSRPSEAGDFRLGQAVGDAASVVVGTLEVLGGFGTGAGGVAACGTGVGCAATPAAVATSSVLVVQGGTLAATGLGHLAVASQDNNPTSGSDAPYEATPENIDRMKQGKAPLDSDGRPVELHHQNQRPEGPVQEMTREQHRGRGNYNQNHPQGNRQPSRIDRNEAARQRREYWKRRAEELQQEPD